MARIAGSSAEKRIALERWEHLRAAPGSLVPGSLAPGSLATPADMPVEGWQPFTAPGLFGPDAEGRLAEVDDHWLRHRLEVPLTGYLLLNGLASHADLFIDGVLMAQSRSMFMPLRLDVNLPAGSEIMLRFHALDDAIKAAPRRARWRPMMIEPNGLRYIRTTALGSMDGWCPEGRPTGPYRSISAVQCAPGQLTSREIETCEIRTALVDGTGQLSIVLCLKAGFAAQHLRLTCAGQSLDLVPDSQGHFAGTLMLPGIAPWWPHTHGEPALHAVSFELDGTGFDLGKTGFRRLEIDRDTDGLGFGLTLNGVPVFARGAVWMTPDITRLPGARVDYAPLLTLARDAGMNMLRVPGVGVYESDDFFALCDELGILVFQDVMLANFDYPQGDEVFCTALEAEVAHLLSDAQTHPSLAVLCGGSEVFQQAAMLGAPPQDWAGPVFDEMLPRLIAQHRPGLPYVPNSPSGGALPFVVNEGVGHYFGVGAYRRPLEDARRAQVRFASECLAFANVPRDAALMDTGVPKDAGADWDFADVRQHYARVLFGDVLPASDRLHAVAEAASAHVMETTFHEWRRPTSPTRGALVLALSNLAPGAGWGVIDEKGHPKAAYYGLKRAFQPLHLGLTDEGVNGLHLHLVNERPEAFSGEIVLEAYREGRTVVARGKAAVTLEAREARTLSAFDLLGGFFDLTYAYRFGGREHDATHIRLLDAAGGLVAEAFHFPDLTLTLPEPNGLAARLIQDEQDWCLQLTCARLARFVGIEVEGFIPDSHGFHLAPGMTKSVRLHPIGVGHRHPTGVIRALNGVEEVRFGP
jgi:beta-mannosidase